MTNRAEHENHASEMKSATVKAYSRPTLVLIAEAEKTDGKEFVGGESSTTTGPS